MELLINKYPVKTECIIHSQNTSIINNHVDKIYVIHLEHDKLRRKYIELLMKKLQLNYTTVIVNKPCAGIYYKLLHKCNRCRKITIGEAGCYMSHMWCLRDIIKNKYKNAIIFEDDIVVHKNLMQLYKDIVCSKSFDYLLLGAADHGFNKGNSKLVKNNIYIPKHHVILGTHAIYYSQYGAKQIYEERLRNPVYFDKRLIKTFTLFEPSKTGVCVPNLFTVENSTSNLYHNFGISKYQKNDYYYNICYKQFNFSDYRFIYLDLFAKYMLETDELSEQLLSIITKKDLLLQLLLNYFNNNKKLAHMHIKKLDVNLFCMDEYKQLLLSAKDKIICMYYENYKDICKEHNITSGTLIKKKIKRSKKNISRIFYKKELEPNYVPSACTPNVIHYKFLKKDNIAHLHCYDLNKFSFYYEDYISKIKQHMDIIITYCSTTYNDVEIQQLFKNYLVIKHDNKGMDIGAKYVALAYLNIVQYNYNYILFLHSKRCDKTRKNYFDSLIGSLDYIIDNSNKNIGGYFPPTIHNGNNDIIIYNHRYLQDNTLQDNMTASYTKNKYYVNELIDYLELPKIKLTLFPSGNCYCLHKDIANKLFYNNDLYDCLNYKNVPDNVPSVYAFDYNWFKLYYSIPFDDIEFAYSMCQRLQLKQNVLQIENINAQLRDGMIEHAYERLLFLIITSTRCTINENYKIKILYNKENKNVDKIDALCSQINDEYRRQIIN